MHLGIIDDRLPIEGHQGGGDDIGPGLVEGFHSDPGQPDLHADPRSHEPTVTLQGMKHAAAHGAAANHSKVYLLHIGRRACRELPPSTIHFWQLLDAPLTPAKAPS